MQLHKVLGEELREAPLFESITIVQESVEEKKANPYKLLTIRGVASKGGELNQNQRLYPTPVLTKATERAQGELRKGKLLGEVDHPDYEGSLKNATIKYTKLWMEGDIMNFEGEVLDCEKGHHLALLLRSGVGIGVSTRGYGSVRPIDGPDGTFYEVQPDFELKGIDCVLEASNKFGKVANFESKGGISMELTLEMLQTKYPELYKQVVEAASAQAVKDMKEGLEKEFELKVAQAIEEKKTAFMVEAKKEVMESEEVKLLKTIVEAVIAAVKPLLPEAKTKEELDAGLVAANESLKTQVESLQGIVSVLKEEKATAEKSLVDQALAKKAAEKINSLVEGHRFEKALRVKLASCVTEEEAQAQFDAEVAFIAKLTEGAEVPKGTGVVRESGADAMTEETMRQRRLAGLMKEGGK